MHYRSSICRPTTGAMVDDGGSSRTSFEIAAPDGLAPFDAGGNLTLQEPTNH